MPFPLTRHAGFVSELTLNVSFQLGWSDHIATDLYRAHTRVFNRLRERRKKKATLSSGGHRGETILRRASRDATTRFVKMSFAISAQATCARVTGGVAVRRNEGARSRPCPRCRHRLLEGFRVLSWQRRKFVPLRPRPLDASHRRGRVWGPESFAPDYI